jgi:putative ABC transport system ATP-binding protein
MPAQLSGGEAQRVAIARALANRPRIILADEPTAALDSERAAIVMDLLRKLAVEQQAAIIAVTHDEKILGHLDRIFRLRDGRLADDGDSARAWRGEGQEPISLAIPSTGALDPGRDRGRED